MLQYVVFLIIVIIIITLSFKIESFSNNVIIPSILPMLRQKGYIVVTLNDKPEQLIQYTFDFKKFNTIKIKNKPANQIIKNISWSKDSLNGRKLIVITQIVNNGDDESYKIYETQNPFDIQNPEIVLQEFKQYKGNDIHFMMCDMNNNYIGLKKHMNKETDTSYIYKLQNDKWVPVDTYSDLRLNKLFFDKDNYLCCIAEDNLIYKKKLLNWKKSTWQKKPEKVGVMPVLDVVFDLDGKLIASTNTGVMKQIYPFYNSAFSKYVHEEIENQLLTINDTIKFKTGLDIQTFDFLNINDYEFNLELL